MKKLAILVMISSVLALSLSSSYAKEKEEKDYLKDLSSPNPDVVIDSADWFGNKGNDKGAPKMMDLLKHSNYRVRMWAAVNLGRLQYKDAVKPLADQLLKEDNADARYAMVLALTRIGVEDEKTVNKLMEAKDRENDPYTKDFIQKMQDKWKK